MEKMTNYTFLYKLDLVNKCGKVNVDATDQGFQSIIAGVIKSTRLVFYNR